MEENLKLCLRARAVDSFPGTTIEPAETESFGLNDNCTTSKYSRSSYAFVV